MNVFKKLNINKEEFYINKEKEIFKIKNQRLEYYGLLDPITNQCVRKHKNRSKFKHPENLFENSKKPLVLYYLKQSLFPYQTQLFCNFLSKKYNVIVIGEILWDITLDNLTLIFLQKSTAKELLKYTFDSIFVEDLRFFCFFPKNKLKTKNITYIHHKLSLNHELIFLEKNYMKHIDKFLFYSKDELLYFYLYNGLKDTKNLEMTKYTFPNINFNGNFKNKNITKVVCYDKHDIDAITFFKKIMCMGGNNKNKKYELILFTDFDTVKHTSNIIYLPRNETNLIEQLKDANIFFTSEIKIYTHFFITLALMFGNIKCVIPRYYKSLENKCILFNKIDDAAKKLYS